MENYMVENLSQEKRGETIFVNHKLEFFRFFEAHRRLCDEISGLKFHAIPSLTGGDKIIITKNNFINGIKTLNSFITDFLSYIDVQAQVDEILTRFEKLEFEFLNDIQYHSFVKKSDNLSNSQEVIFSNMYINYLLRTFEIANLMSMYLQKSLNIATREVKKNIGFVDYDGFYKNLAIYKSEVAMSLGNLSYDNIFDNFKKITGYFYTYRFLMSNKYQDRVLVILKLLQRYMTSEDTIRIILKMKGSNGLSKTNKELVVKDVTLFRQSFNEIYKWCNKSFQAKNILPKSKSDILVDTTLI